MLSEVCPPVETFDDDLAKLADDMLETMYAAPGRGLAAPQVARTERMFVMDVAWKDGAADPFICVNPEILSASHETALGEEGCLSIPGVTMQVDRPVAIRLAWQTPDGKRLERDLTGAAARCAQHELDHLNGILIFRRVPDDMRARYEAQYRDTLA